MKKRKKKNTKPKLDKSKGLAKVGKTAETTMSSKQIIITYFFESDSNCEVTYQTQVFSDGSMSCDCRGWIYKARTMPDGQRTCKHTRLVQAGLADTNCKRKVDYRTSGTTAPVLAGPEVPQPTLTFTGKRKFDFTV